MGRSHLRRSFGLGTGNLTAGVNGPQSKVLQHATPRGSEGRDGVDAPWHAA